MRFHISEPVGIEIVNPIIYDSRGLFYDREGKRRINLPIGEYEINNSFKVIPFIKYPLPNLPIREKLLKVPKVSDIKISFIDGLKYKGQIDVHLNYMELNSSLKKCSSAEFYAVLFHELGHYRYYTEYKCDIYSIYRMLQIGFNPSQIKIFLSILKKSDGRKAIAMKLAKNSDNERNTNPSSWSNWLRSIFNGQKR